MKRVLLGFLSFSRQLPADIAGEIERRWYVYAGILLLLAGCLAYGDRRAAMAIAANRRSPGELQNATTTVAKLVSKSGELHYPLLVMLLLYCRARWKYKQRPAEWRRQQAMYAELAGLVIYAVVTSQLVKIIAGRVRPHIAMEPWQWLGPIVNSKYHSFPSGHALTSTLFAVYVWSRGRNRACRWLVMAWAIAVSASRLYLNRHWLSDVVAGAAVGFLLAAANAPAGSETIGEDVRP